MKAGRVYKVYPDKLTEQCCKGVFFGAIAQAVITLGLLVTTIVTKQFGKLHPMMHLFAFACMLVAAGLFAAAAYVGMRREFHMLFFYASVAMAFGAILLSVDAGIAFSSMTDGHTLSLVGQIIIVAAMLLSILTLIVGDDAKKQFYKLSDDRLMIGGVGILMALAGLVAVFCALFDKGGSPMKIWEALFFFVILVLVSAMPVVLLFGCSRLTDSVTDREIEEGTIVPGGSNVGAGNKNAKKYDKKDGGRDRKNDKNASKNDGRPGKGNADKKSDKKPDKSVKAEDESKKDGKDEKSGKQETPSEDKKDKKDGAKGFGFLKGKDKDKNKGKKDKDSKKDSGSEREESGDVIATTKHKPVKSTNPTDLDAFLREAEEADERKVRDAVWEAAREKEREVEKEKEKAEEAAFSEKNSKKKDKKSKKDRKKEKEKVYSGVNTALFTNPNKPKEKRYIPTVNVGLNHADAAEETAEEEIRIESASIFDEPAQKAVETAAETAETVTEVAENVAEDVFGSLEETNAVAEAAEEVASAVADEAAELEGAAAGEAEELAEEAEAAVEAAEEAAENAAGAFDSSTVAEAAEDAEQILRNHEEAMRKLREEINLRLGERYQAEKTNDIEEYLGDSSEDDVTRAAEEAAFAAIDAAEESIDDAEAAEETVEDAFGEAAESAEDAFGETAEAAEDTFGETAEAVEDTFGEAVENAEDAFGETAEAAEAVEDTFGEAVESAEDAFGETAEAAEDTFGEVAEAVEDTFGEAVESAEDAFGETAEAAEDTFGAVEEAAEDAFGAAEETFSAAEDAFDSVGTIGGFAEDTSDDSAGDLFRAAANKPRAVASSFAEAMEEAAGEDLFAASPVFRSAEEAPKYEEETTEEDTFGAVEFTEAVREPAKRRWFMEDDYDKKPTASLEADDLFAPVGTKPVSASVPEFAPAEEVASAKPAEAVAAESAETEEEEPVVEVPSQNQAILWALQHGGSFETAKEEAAADAEPAEADVADAGAAEEEPSSFAEAMAEAMGRPTVAPSFAGSASVGAVATETAEEKESGEEEPEVVVPNANQAILWAMMHGGSIEAAKQAVAEQAAARAAEATKAAEAVQAEAVTLIDEADEIPEEVLAGNYYDEAGEDIADAATEAYETVSESVDEAEDFASTLAQAREKWAHLNGEGVSDDEFEDSPAEPEFPEAPAYDEPLYETAEEFGETDSAPAEENVEPMYAEAPAELTEEPASTAEQEVEAEEASVTETAEYEAEETSETETDEYDGEASEEEESEPEGPIVPEYLQQQAISVEERARRAAAKAAAAKSAPKPVKQADTSIDDFTKKLKQLKVAYENDLITEEEYNEAKKHLLELL